MLCCAVLARRPASASTPPLQRNLATRPPPHPTLTQPTPQSVRPAHADFGVAKSQYSKVSRGDPTFPGMGEKQSHSGEQTFEMHKNSMEKLVLAGRGHGAALPTPAHPRVSTARPSGSFPGRPCKSSAARPHPFSSTCHVTVNQTPRRPSGPAASTHQGQEPPFLPRAAGPATRAHSHLLPQHPSGRPEQAGTEEGEPRCGRAAESKGLLSVKRSCGQREDGSRVSPARARRAPSWPLGLRPKQPRARWLLLAPSSRPLCFPNIPTVIWVVFLF